MDGIVGCVKRRSAAAGNMNIIGQVESLWRYPIKSMAGERLTEAFLGYAGVYGDRKYAFISAAGRKGFPYLTARDLPRMVTYCPRYRDAALASAPPNHAEAHRMGELSPHYPSFAALQVDVQTPSGERLAADNPALIAMLAGEGGPSDLSLVQSHRAMTDSRPVSLISRQTVSQLADETGVALDERRFRANICAELGAGGFAEDALVGRRLQVGSQAVVAVLEQDARCKIIALDPDTGEETPEVLRNVTRRHGRRAGVYCAVLREGLVRTADRIVVMD
jgi:uncharacterized protein YcbX